MVAPPVRGVPQAWMRRERVSMNEVSCLELYLTKL
jgi:hypothetical protein